MAQPSPPTTRPTTRPTRAAPANNTRFFGSQIGGRSVINYGYTDMPWKLMAWDVYYFFKYSWAIPYILWPLSPADSGELSELSPTKENIRAIAIHLVLCILQLGGLVALPALAVLPIWTATIIVGVFLLVNKLLCMLLNGKEVEYHSDPKYAPALPEHAHEQWIFINGVAVGSHWMQTNLNRLAASFKRPILGIHNRTSGILFDVVECLIQRNWGYATKDVRVCYRIIKKKLYNPQYSKVIFILHSQGAIEGSLILDWLLQELPQDLLSKLEVYTFGNAANHFNNPHRHIRTQNLAKLNPSAACVDSVQLTHNREEAARVPRRRCPQPGSRPNSSSSSNSSSGSSSSSRSSSRSGARSSSSSTSFDLDDAADSSNRHSTPTTTETESGAGTATALFTAAAGSSPHPSHHPDRAIGYIEHYAHTTDFVAAWGVLHFATSSPSSQFVPRFIGRVFARTSPRGGHQMVQHYLDGMFPLRRDPATGELARNADGVPLGVEEEGNEFMESEVLVGGGGDGTGREEGEGEELSDGEAADGEEQEQVEVVDVSPEPARAESGDGAVSPRKTRRKRQEGVRVKVKDVSRLWQYRNGRSPEETPPLLVRGKDGVVRNATM
ncbi:hypothetical protein MYCTH_2308601 [Thermothelomyces thermophilus ATCC 42464]|uniref:DUF676 domain-containing protein n=1 Tax=Thermothelomyces thermophilus (strain ATCC 42464 / BCRC 31852 / DSM 1799) TaxID=573729 RepID=G2QK16_THET4|nr:uncharacterized protein MYCTH_2308601 [Thermothelomyces thermophilus ATCC 42464]AEO59922.1 hypothetical protein MYCTH_2308601 [Thermothelomyces thermophilus ATCC 42464]